MEFVDTEGFRKHLENALQSTAKKYTFEKGPVRDLPAGFCIFEFAQPERGNWFYCTVGMSFFDEIRPIELFMVSERQAPELVEILYATAHFHVTCEKLDTGHTVNFGKPWLPESMCDYGLIIGMEGTRFQWLQMGDQQIEFLWLIAISEAERNYKVQHGLDALGKLFVEKQVNVEMPSRVSAIE